MSNGSMVFLAVSYYADRKENVYKTNVVPDVAIQTSEDTKEDKALNSAVDWILEKGK